MLLYAAPRRCIGLRSPFRTFSASTIQRFRIPPKFKSNPQSHTTRPTTGQKWARRAALLGAVSASAAIAYNTYQPFRHTVLAVDRISRVVRAAALDAVDYKRTLAKTYDTPNAEYEALGRCHKRSAERLLEALQTNGGIFIKLVSNVDRLLRRASR